MLNHYYREAAEDSRRSDFGTLRVVGADGAQEALGPEDLLEALEGEFNEEERVLGKNEKT